MADPIDVPIKLPTDTSGPKAGAAAVKGLISALNAMGEAGARGGKQAQAAVVGVATAAAKAQVAVEKTAAQQAARTAGEAARAKAREERKAASDAAKTAQKEQEKAARQAAKAQEDAAKKAAKHARDTAEIQRSFMKGAADKRAADLDEIRSMALGAVTVVASLVATVAALSAKFVSALVSVQAFKESTMGAFSRLLGSNAKAQDAFRKTIAVADEIGISYQDALAGVNSLVAKDFGADQAQQLVKAMADLKSVVPDANIKNLLLAVTQIKSKGVLQMEELQGQIAEAGLSVSVVLEEIGKKIGKSAADVRKLISQGKISADQGVQGILAAIQKTTGKPLGDAAKEASMSLGGLLARLEQIPSGLLMMADSTAGLKTLKDVLKNIVSAFAPSTAGGKALSASIGRLGDAFGTFLGGLTGKGGAAKLEAFAMALASAADRAADLVKSFGELGGPIISGFIEGFSQASKLLDGDKAKSNSQGYAELGKALGSVARSLGMLTALSADVGMLTGALGTLFGLTGQSKAASISLGDMLVAALGPLAWLDDLTVIGSKLSAFWSQIKASITAAATEIGVSAQSIGTNLVAGIIAGITGGQGGLLGAVSSMVGAVTGAAAGGWKVQSPSRVFAGLGYQLPAGGAMGVERGTPVLQRAVSRMAQNATPASLGPAPVTLGGGGGPSLTINQLGPFYARTEADARAIGQVVRAEIRAAWAEIGGTNA